MDANLDCADLAVPPPSPISEVAARNQKLGELYYKWIGHRVRIACKPANLKNAPANVITGVVTAVDPRPFGYSEGYWLVVLMDAKWVGKYGPAVDQHTYADEKDLVDMEPPTDA